MTKAARECLIIFTRYPEPGKTKTRLIPVLGAEGAATLQRQMTEQKLAEVKKLQAFYPLSVEIHFAGGNKQLMQEWLGSSLVYRRQSEGDIGCRMASAFLASFEAGINAVVLIGTDCPDLNAQLMAGAFLALPQHDLVLGPALDGGYYLIGLRRLIPELFTGIRWSTAEVLPQTLRIAQRLNLAVAQLPLLSDVDRPEDLSVWKANNHERA
jgi:rSAM/selenodomain-associated transferase 1